MSVGNVVNLDDLALEVGCRTRTLSTTYPDLPLGMCHNTIELWDVVEEKFRKKLTFWKRQYISKGGRLTLLRSTPLKPTYLYYVFVSHA